MISALIVGLSGERLSQEEASFLRDISPAGVILFKRNCATPDQVRGLVGAVYEAVDRPEMLVLVDQEGGRVQRLGPPHWRALPAAGVFGERYAAEPELAMQAARSIARLAAHDLKDVGINMNCAPVADLRIHGAHDIIADRAFGASPQQVADLAGAVAEGFLAGGVVPVLKHIPGHGRALADSHLELPRVEARYEELMAWDFEPFRLLNGLPAAMTAHVLYAAVDPEHAASVSKIVTETVIRGGIGFDAGLERDDCGAGRRGHRSRIRCGAPLQWQP